MYIVHIASELAQIAKVGGLADVIQGLTKALSQAGHQVEIILPKYAGIEKDLKPLSSKLISYEWANEISNTIWETKINGVRVFLIDPALPYFNRKNIYGYPDDVDRFTYFSRAALEMLFKFGKRPNIIHIHDWMTALVAPLYKQMYIPLGFSGAKVMLTIHSLDYQGICKGDQLAKVGLPKQEGEINLLKMGIEYADHLTTVSPTYEREIKTPEAGLGLDKLLTEKKIVGILNGIDTDYWNPETDPHLGKHYTIHTAPSGKAENRKQVRKHFKLEDAKKPLVACISRLVPQKSPELIQYALEHTLTKGGQFVLLGTTLIPEIEKTFKKIEQNPNLGISLETNETLAHLIFAAADMFIIPSRTEPCGLTQMIALRYGTVPIVRRTGGLADTVNETNGFSFDSLDSQGVDSALDPALDLWKNHPHQWHKLMQQGMSEDHSWTHAAAKYIRLYLMMLEN